jgi:DUF4097 and DUF4098 domain-containing protein YvlB
MRQILAAALLVFASLGTVSAQAERSITRSIPVQAAGQLDLSTDVGSIDVRPGSTDSIDIEVLFRADDTDDLDRLIEDFTLDVDQQGSDVRVEGRMRGERNWWGWNWRRRREVSFRVTLPEAFSVELQTSGGSIAVRQIKGEVDVNTSGGSLDLSDIGGPIRGRTSGGSIELRRAGSEARVETSGGSIRIEEVTGDVNARTSGGSIDIDTVSGYVVAHTSGGSVEVNDARGGVDASTSGGRVDARFSSPVTQASRLSTSGGSVTVTLAPEVGFDVDARAGSGVDARDFGFDNAGRRRREPLRAQLNGGGPELELRASGGSIRLRSR